MARNLGAKKFLVWTDKAEMESAKASLDLIINTGTVWFLSFPY
jgi:hypothetical protein